MRERRTRRSLPLRADGLISLAGKLPTIEDWPRLKEIGEFNTTYLHIRDPMPV
jgi:hypothetical protein